MIIHRYRLLHAGVMTSVYSVGPIVGMTFSAVCLALPETLLSRKLCVAVLIHSFIHSGHFYSAPSSSLLLRGAPDYSTDTVSEFHAEAHRQL